jgi:hypothetical protein
MSCAWFAFRNTVVVAAFLTLAATLHPRASAQDREGGRVDATRLYGGLWLGFGGDATWDGDGEFAGDLETTVGGQFGVDAITTRHFSLGGEARFGAVKWKVDDRSRLIDLDFKPRLRFPLRKLPLEFYVAVPVGLTVPRLARLGEAPHDTKVGWNLGAGGGVNLFLTEDFGLNVEPMWLMHRFKTHGANDGEFTLKQFALFLNAVVAL